MKYYLISFLGIAVFFLLVSFSSDVPSIKDRSVSGVLISLGDKAADNQPNFTYEGVSAEAGADLVLRGKTKKSNGKGSTSIQSKHFVCTSCHNVKREDPDLSKVDPLGRLHYANKNKLPFLQGTTLYGAVNRTSFYNDDYYKKYGELVTPARNDIRGAIQLCAVECSQGRALEDWELESVLAYLWTIDLKMSDLNLSENEFKTIEQKVSAQEKSSETIDLVKSKYLSGAPATFADAPSDRKKGYDYKGNPENGKLIYELGCLHCHKEERYSFFNLDNSKKSFKCLDRDFPKYNEMSIYHVGRYGTKPLPGKKAYMPMYTLEKMSNNMMEDLRAYVELKAD